MWRCVTTAAGRRDTRQSRDRNWSLFAGRLSLIARRCNLSNYINAQTATYVQIGEGPANYGPEMRNTGFCGGFCWSGGIGGREPIGGGRVSLLVAVEVLEELTLIPPTRRK